MATSGKLTFSVSRLMSEWAMLSTFVRNNSVCSRLPCNLHIGLTQSRYGEGCEKSQAEATLLLLTSVPARRSLSV